jgi:hypothetical protein
VQLSISDASEALTFVLHDALADHRAGREPELDAAVAAMTRLEDQVAALAVPDELRDAHCRVVAVTQDMAADVSAEAPHDDQLAAVVRVQRGLRSFGRVVGLMEAVRARGTPR